MMPQTAASTLFFSGSRTTHQSLPRLTVITAAVIALLIKRVWFWIWGTRSADASHNIPPILSTPAARLPQEIIKMVIAHLIYDKPGLLACSLTCYSWHIAAAPRLHHTLITPTYSWYLNKNLVWPRPLQAMNELGLLPLVRKFQVREGTHLFHDRFSQHQFSSRTLHHFQALTNVQELGIEYLDIPSFMPGIRQYFNHFSPTVRSLSLRAPKGSHRQIIYFIGLFQHLEDLKILYGTRDDIQDPQEEPADNATLIPPFAPPLRGRLTVVGLKEAGLLKEMIDLFGGIRFRYMDIYDVEGTQLLLAACVDTLETLRLNPEDPRGKKLSPKHIRVLANNFAGISSLHDFDLSRNKLLRTLEVRALCLYETGLLTHALSTITSPAFSEVTVIYQDSDFPPLFRLSPAGTAKEAAAHPRRFKAFRAMHNIRNFQLVLCAHVRHDMGEYSVRRLKHVIAAEKAKMRYDFIFPEPAVFHSPREFDCRFDKDLLFSL